ncbi:MAG: NAD-dependent epimerase/dehydratase family protein [Bryobacteraceae bacterium]|nr:NAD-dependent epimerase/dehydratase family protein [Bryobacteraceae bacterium]MDW8377078.1 NAD-dependent epimerase/dehydratase family protein [Bryobacterales bacterium]
MRVLVTGAQGCIGAWVVRSLLRRGLDVLIFDLVPEPARLLLITEPHERTRLRITTGAIEETDRVKALIRDEGITHVIHLAAVLMPFCQQHPVKGALINVVGTLNVFEGAREAGRPVRVVYASSSAVWGPEDAYEPRPLSESDATKPTTHYGVFKQANEGNARVFFSVDGISSVGLRPWTVYGVGRDAGLTAAPTIAMRHLVLGKPYQIPLGGFMDLQYVEDVAEAFVMSALSPLEGAHVFNLAGEVVHMDAFLEALEVLRPGARRLISASGPQVPVAYKMDDSALQRLIPGIPKTPLAEGMRKTVELYEKLRAEGRLE